MTEHESRYTLRCQCGGWQRTNRSLIVLAAQWAQHLLSVGYDSFGHEATLGVVYEGTGW